MDTKPRVISKHERDIYLIGDNVLYNHGVITAYYILPLYNYSTASPNGAENAIVGLTTLLSNLASQRTNLQFRIERISKVIKAEDVKKNLVDTVRLYCEDFAMPAEFTSNIRDDVQDYALLCVDIQEDTFGDIEEYSLRDTAKELFNALVVKLSGLGNLRVDVEKILGIEDNIFGVLRHRCARASREIIFYAYTSRLFPSYEISYTAQSFINSENFENIMSTLSQTVCDNFGWFELHNDGIALFDLPTQVTYGCILDVKSFPAHIASDNFPMDYPGCVTNISCLKKEDAEIKLKRNRSSNKFEYNQAAQVGAESEALHELGKSISVATHALSQIDNGETLCKFDCSILVTGLSKEELKQNVLSVMSDCKDRDILVGKSLTQASDFLNKYVNMRVTTFPHFANLQFPLSFQQNSGAIVGDAGSKIYSPSIGEDLH